jgi:hypothetical protein
MSNIISHILFYAVWLPICLLLVGVVMLWAILYTLCNYVISFFKWLFE